jgi:hypothetical protein
MKCKEDEVIDVELVQLKVPLGLLGINDEDLDGFVTFNNRYTGTQGSVTLVESLIIDGKDCRSLSIHAERSGKTTYDRMINLCLTASGDWVQIDTRKK